MEPITLILIVVGSAVLLGWFASVMQNGKMRREIARILNEEYGIPAPDCFLAAGTVSSKTMRSFNVSMIAGALYEAGVQQGRWG